MNAEKNDPHLTTKIVRSYVGHHTVRPEQLAELITSVHRALGQLGHPPQLEEVLTPAVSVRRSVHQNYVVCLDCGYRGKTLRRHISARHGLGRNEYLKRRGLRSDHPLSAPAYTELRSTMAKALGLGRKSAAGVIPAVTLTRPVPLTVDQEPEARPRQRRRPRSAQSQLMSRAKRWQS